MYTGDFIFARALQSLSHIEHPVVHQVLARTMVELCNGEVIQIEDKFQLNQNLKTYFRRIKRKTALLIESSCYMGALAAGVSKKDAIHLKRFGYFVGMSYQIIDDILDFTATDKELGKPAGSDLLNGNVTLPVIFMQDDARIRAYVEKIQAGRLTEAERQEMLTLVRHSEAIQQASAISERYLQKALYEIEQLPKHPMKKKLRDIALFIGKRDF